MPEPKILTASPSQVSGRGAVTRSRRLRADDRQFDHFAPRATSPPRGPGSPIESCTDAPAKIDHDEQVVRPAAVIWLRYQW